MIKHIPNLITCSNLLCGCLGIVFAFQGNLEWSVYSIWAAMVFDFLDGFTARMLKVSSDIGKQLDSLADMVTFGLLPAVFLFHLFSDDAGYLAYLSFLVAVFSAFRLAKFNVDDSQSDSFVGMPTPANALFISSLLFVFQIYPELKSDELLAVFSVMCSFWLIMPVRLLALKFSGFDFKLNLFRYLLILTSIVLFIIFGRMSFPLIILSYLILSIVNNLTISNNIIGK
ncbi:CDP-diacylglycerol--serine O-phosphatidyltransferase [Fulvivirga lutea]|uniref:CDP-diacylglycerol--serine O-phosphatidyltransferase n=1 Tax=Fulvivirga lutea TaxID=2810512 RepID=A0A974WIV0_9BACT|nr:CDP-diacylglycerol--serine O-phosphatidyltransferase [Fulvivirga lutea]QSE97937.1 CDP-diacylglycerol--serine O-phosphatidyltransferase [Fulvivirga lutea]